MIRSVLGIALVQAAVVAVLATDESLRSAPERLLLLAVIVIGLPVLAASATGGLIELAMPRRLLDRRVQAGARRIFTGAGTAVVGIIPSLLALVWLCPPVPEAVALAGGPALGAAVVLGLAPRRRRGRCVHCGYDLRAARGRCSECGADDADGAGSRPYRVRMTDPNPIAHALRTMLDNQEHRTDAALEDLPDDAWRAYPGGDCNSIEAIGRHLLELRRFQLALLESPRATSVPDPGVERTPAEFVAALVTATSEVRAAIDEHEPDDWCAAPATPRDGLWGDEPMLDRFVRPFNDFTNHLGAIRAIRRLRDCGATRTQ